MREGKPSRTSTLVTFLRALADGGVTQVRDFSDPTAMELLPAGWRISAELIRRMAHARPEVIERVARESGGGFDLVALRTRVLDEAWHDAHRSGMRQLVILGAGLDGRAYRLDDVGEVAVFEVDHPATGALKQQKARRLQARARRHRFVPVNFERDRLWPALESAGHRADEETFWIWEGVTPYLTAEAMRSTLGQLAERSAPGSRLAMTYIEPGAESRETTWIRKVIAAAGEPWIGLMSRGEVAQRLQAAGFRVLEDTGMAEWLPRFSRFPEVSPERALRERIVVAER